MNVAIAIDLSGDVDLSYPFIPARESEGFDVDHDRWISQERRGQVRNDPRVKEAEKVVSALFFNGGTLGEHGFAFKESLKAQGAFSIFRAMLGSFDPQHEIKTTTCALALLNWCNRIEPTKAEQRRSEEQERRELAKERKNKARKRRGGRRIRTWNKESA